MELILIISAFNIFMAGRVYESEFGVFDGGRWWAVLITALFGIIIIPATWAAEWVDKNIKTKK